MATITKRPTGWQAKIRIIVDGQRITRSATRDTKKEAQDWATSEEAAIREGRSPTQDPELTVDRMFEAWLGDWLRDHPQRRPKDEKTMRTIAAWWQRKLGRRRAAAVTRAEVRQALRELRNGDSPSGKPASAATQNRYAAWCSVAFEWAIEEGWAKDNPARGAKVNEGSGRLRYLSSTAISGGGGDEFELERLLEAVGEVAALGSKYRVRGGHPWSPGWVLEIAVHLALCTGARQGEIMAARWRWIDLAGRTITFPDTKSGSPRTVPLMGKALELLARRRADIGDALRFPAADDRIFGGAAFPRRAWVLACERAAVKIRFHDLRHTAATYLTAAGAPESVVRQILGHKSATMTQRYAHAAPSATAEAVAKLAKMLGS